jgi:DNA polymerase III epsilon subunit-like protein
MHLNGHIMACVDVETTGLRPRYHDIIQVCVLPLNSDFDPLEGVTPFYTEMKPKRPENIDQKAMSVSKLRLCEIMTRAPDSERVADYFCEWYDKLPLPHNKRLMPLAHNWIFDYQFMEDWLGYEHMQHFFHGHFRDLMVAGLYENDKAAFHIEPYPYPKHDLAYYCSQLGVKNPNPHDALGDCWSTAQAYKKVVLAGTFTPVHQQPTEIPDAVPSAQ